MRIGFVSIILESWGGSEELWSEAALALLKDQHQVFISKPNTGSVAPKIQRLINQNAEVIYKRGFIKPGLPFKKRAPKKIVRFLINKIRNPYKEFFQKNPDIIIYTGACDSLKDDPLFLKLLYKKQIPLLIINQVYYESTKTFNDNEAAMLIKAFSYAQRNLFVSLRNKEVMERFLGHTIPKAEVIRNPFNLQHIEALPAPSSEKISFAMVANLLVNHKGHDIVFALLSKESWKMRNWHLNIYGAGMDEIYLKRLCLFYALDDRVTFFGRVNDIKKVWQKNHLLLLPSRLEGTPLALVEAMLCARPVVATDVGGNMEWIIDEVNGFIAEGANVYSFDRAMEKAWQQKENWPQLGIKAYEQALKLYDPDPGKTLAQIIYTSTG